MPFKALGCSLILFFYFFFLYCTQHWSKCFLYLDQYFLKLEDTSFRFYQLKKMERPLFFLCPVFISVSNIHESNHSLNAQIMELFIKGKKKTSCDTRHKCTIVKRSFFKVQKFCKLLSTVRRGGLCQKIFFIQNVWMCFYVKVPKEVLIRMFLC